MNEKAFNQANEYLKEFNCEKLFFRGEDIPALVEEFNKQGVKTIGLTGNDLFQEYLSKNQSNLSVLKTIEWKDENFLFKKPNLCLLGKKELTENKKTLEIIINRKYEELSKIFLEKLSRNCFEFNTKTFNGNTELAVSQGLADYCVEIVCSGKTLKETGLMVLDRFFESDLVIIGVNEKQTGFLEELYKTILQRIESNNCDSFTAKIAQKKLVLKKFNEECFELVQASIENNKTKIVWETADVLYFLTVLLAEKKIKFQEIWNELNRRKLEKTN